MVFFEHEGLNSLYIFLLTIIPIGAGARIVSCALSSMADADKQPENTKRIKNVIAFTILAECLVGFVGVILKYYA